MYGWPLYTHTLGCGCGVGLGLVPGFGPGVGDRGFMGLGAGVNPGVGTMPGGYVNPGPGVGTLYGLGLGLGLGETPGAGVGVGLLEPVIVPLMGVGIVLLVLSHLGIWQHIGSFGSGSNIHVGAMLLYVGHLSLQVYSPVLPSSQTQFCLHPSVHF